MNGSTPQPDEFNYRPATIATGAWIGIGLALDAYLIVKRKDRLISDVLRTKPGKAFLIVFILHIINGLGRADPFSAAASVINARLAKSAPVLSEVLTDVLAGE